MPKRVLIAEENDTIRGVAETALRQNGYEVISVAGTAKVFEVLEYSLPDLLLIGADLKSENGQLCIARLKSQPRTSTIPMLVLAGTDTDVSSLPSEVVIPQPFDPGVLLTRMAALSVSSGAASKQAADNPLGDAGLDDDLLDAALGLDAIQVTDSEDMDKTVMGKGDRAGKSGPVETMAGLGHFESKKELTDSAKVESLVLSDDTTDIKHTSDARQKAKDDAKITSGIDIMQDQYGLSDPDAFKMDSNEGEHDYNWFVNSMQAEHQIDTPSDGSAPTDGPIDELTFTEQSAMVDPVTPGPSVKPVAIKEAKGEGVDKFIDEFKKEIEQIRTDESESADLPEETPPKPGAVKKAASKDASWEDQVERIDPKQYGALFTQELMRQVAGNIADKLVARLDSEKLLQLVKHEVVQYLKKNPKS